MNILLIGTPYFGYIERIRDYLLKIGYHTELLYDSNFNIKDRFCKFVSTAYYNETKDKYFQKYLKQLSQKKYNTILVVGGRYLPVSFLSALRKMYSGSRFILYLSSDIDGYPLDYFTFYDEIYTYSKQEAEKNRFKYQPFFYSKTLISEKFIDWTFIGSLHSDRLNIIHGMLSKNAGLKNFVYVYSNWINFLKCPRYYPSISSVQFKSLNYDKYIELLSKSIATIEIPDIKQGNITTRPIECLGTNTKIITRSKSILHYDFYNKDNVFIYESGDDLSLTEWIKIPYKQLDNSLLAQYKIENWIKQILK